jgi:activating signal cointegrator 1
MKAITIIQPWATLIALGEKKFETRSWATKHRGPLAIHAGKKIDKEVCQHEEIRAALARHGYTVDNLPAGR